MFQVLDIPSVRWRADPNSLYTLIIADLDIEGQATPNYLHYLKTNIPGNNVQAGDENNQYIPPFVFFVNAQGALEASDPARNHRFAVLVFKQNDRLNLPVVADYCSQQGIFGRSLVRLLSVTIF